MRKESYGKAIIAGMMLVAFGAYAKAPLAGTFISQVSANDEGEDISSNQDSGGDSNNNESSKKAAEMQKESAKKGVEMQKESAKKSAEIQRESAKRQAEILKKSQEQQNEATKNRQKSEFGSKVVNTDVSGKADFGGENENEDNDNSNEVENDNDGDDDNGNDIEDGGLNANRAANDRFKHANEKIAEAEKHILEQQREGKDVTIALERLAQAKKMLGTIDAAATNTGKDDASEDFVKESLKLAHTAQEDDVRSINDADKFIKKANERIDQATEKLTRLASTGEDTANYQSMINVATVDLNKAKQLLLNNSLLESVAVAQKSESEAKSAKRAIESALLALGVEDNELSGDHKSTVAKAVDDLLYVADVEGENGIGKKVREIARAQRDSADKVDALVDDAQSRSGFSEFVLGPKYDDLNSIQEQITENEARIQALVQAKNQMTDSDLQAVVQEHITALTEENAKLQSFVSGKETKKGIFGWVFRLFR